MGLPKRSYSHLRQKWRHRAVSNRPMERPPYRLFSFPCWGPFSEILDLLQSTISCWKTFFFAFAPRDFHRTFWFSVHQPTIGSSWLIKPHGWTKDMMIPMVGAPAVLITPMLSTLWIHSRSDLYYIYICDIYIYNYIHIYMWYRYIVYSIYIYV